MKSVSTVIAVIVAIPVVFLIIMFFGAAGRKVIGDDPDQMDKPSHWFKTIVIGIIGLLLFGYVTRRSGCGSERAADYEMENSRDRGY